MWGRAFLSGLSKLLSLLPVSLALFFGRLLGLFWYYIIPIRKKLVIQQIPNSSRAES